MCRPSIVFCNGGFDVFHIGHLRFLEAAGALGDRLIVSLDTDANLSRRKPGRPIAPLIHRMEMLWSVRCVDVVLSHDDREGEVALIRSIRPDVLAKSEEYRGTEIPGEAFAGRVVFLPRFEGWSTSKLYSLVRNNT